MYDKEFKGIWKKAVMAYLKVLSWHLLEGLRKNHKNVSQDSWSPGRDLNPGPSKYEAGVLTTQLHSVVINMS
jgi:hypothetical protein